MIMGSRVRIHLGGAPFDILRFVKNLSFPFLKNSWSDVDERGHRLRFFHAQRRDVVASLKAFRFTCMRFRVQPGGASNSLPLWENNSCFPFLASYLFWREITQVLGYNTANKKKSVFYFLSAEFLIGQVFSNQTHSLSIH